MGFYLFHLRSRSQSKVQPADHWTTHSFPHNTSARCRIPQPRDKPLRQSRRWDSSLSRLALVQPSGHSSSDITQEGRHSIELIDANINMAVIETSSVTFRKKAARPNINLGHLSPKRVLCDGTNVISFIFCPKLAIRTRIVRVPVHRVRSYMMFRSREAQVENARVSDLRVVQNGYNSPAHISSACLIPGC